MATAVAHAGAGACVKAGSIWLFVIAVGGAEIFGLWIVQGRGDDIRSARPLTQIDYTTAVAAKGKVRVGLQPDLSAGGTT